MVQSELESKFHLYQWSANVLNTVYNEEFLKLKNKTSRKTRIIQSLKRANKRNINTINLLSQKHTIVKEGTTWFSSRIDYSE